MSQKANIVIDQGANSAHIINVLNSNNLPVNLTGYTAQAQMRKSPTTSKFYNFVVDITSSTGVITLKLDANTSQSIPSGRYFYDCIVRDSNGLRSKVVEGVVTIKPGASVWTG